MSLPASDRAGDSTVHLVEYISLKEYVSGLGKGRQMNYVIFGVFGGRHLLAVLAALGLLGVSGAWATGPVGL